MGFVADDRWVSADGAITLIHADCMDVMPTLMSAVDAVITDPPFGIQAAKAKAHSSIRDNKQWPKCEWDDARPSDDTLRTISRFAPAVAIWGGNYFADCLPASSGWLVWRKPEAETGFSLADAELCWTSGPFAARMKTAGRRDGHDHPTQKPVSIMGWTIDEMKLKPGSLVFDPYMGSGTTGVACIHKGMRFIGVDRERRYFEAAIRRIEQEQDRSPLFEKPADVQAMIFVEGAA